MQPVYHISSVVTCGYSKYVEHADLAIKWVANLPSLLFIIIIIKLLNCLVSC